MAKHADEAETACEKLADALAAHSREAETVKKTRKEVREGYGRGTVRA